MCIKITNKHKSCISGVPVFVKCGIKNMKIKNKDGIKLLRESVGLSRDEFAQTVGVSDRTVEGWELGRSINIESLINIHNIYGD